MGEGPRPLLIKGVWGELGNMMWSHKRLQSFHCLQVFKGYSSPICFVRFIFLLGHGRGRRTVELTEMSPCTREGQAKWLKCIEKQNRLRVSKQIGTRVDYDMKCSYKNHLCFYVFTCKPKGDGGYECSEDAHFINYTGLCCYPIC